MKHYIQRFTAVVLLLLLGLLPQHSFGAAVQVNTLSAAWLSGSAGSRVATNLFNYGVSVKQIVVQNQNAGATTIAFYDSHDKAIETTASIASYTVSDIAALWITNSVGVYGTSQAQTNVTKVGINTNKSVGSTTTPRALILNLPTLGSTTTTYNFDPPLIFGRGITVTNHNATQVLTFSYEPLLPQ